MKGKRLISLLMVVAMLAALLTACGGSGANKPEQKPTEAAGPAETVPAVKASSTDISGKSIFLISSARAYDGMDDAWAALTADFEAETGCHVDYQFNGSFPELIQTFQAAKMSGATYDMSSLGAGNLHQSVAKTGVIMDITPLAEQLKDRVLEGTIDAHTIGGHTFGIPSSQLTTMGLFINMDMLKELGLSLEPGYTYAELKAVCDTVKAEKGFTALIHSGADWWWWPSFFFATFAQTTHNDSIHQIEEWLKGNRSMVEDDAIQAFQLILDMFNDGIMDADSLQHDGTAVAAIFAQEKCLGFFASPTNITYLQDVDFEIGYLPYPVWVEGAIPQSSGGGDEGTNLLTLGDPDNVVASARLLEYFLRPEVNASVNQLGNNFGYAVVGVEGAKTQISDEAYELFTENTIRYLDWFWDAEHNDAVVKAIQGLVAKEISAEDAAQMVQDCYDSSVADNDYVYEWWESEDWDWSAIAMPYEVDLNLD